MVENDLKNSPPPEAATPPTSSSLSVNKTEDKVLFQPSNLRVSKRHTRILGTLNRRANQEFINMMIRYGMDGVRIFKDYGHEVCQNLIQWTREAAEEHQTRVVVKIELRQQSKLFLGETENDEKIHLNQGDTLRVTQDETHIATQKNMTIAVRNKESAFSQGLVGKNVFFDMGSICAIVRRVIGTQEIECEIQNEGWIYQNQTIVFERKKKNRSSSPAKIATQAQSSPNKEAESGSSILQPVPMNSTDANDDDDDGILREDIRFILQNDIDFVIHSVYSGQQEILELKEVMQQEAQNLGELCTNPDVRIMAKLENEDAINDINQILDVCDAILVPRGQLGTVLPIEKISWIQKNIIKLCNYKAKPVILASQFLDSMVFNPFPLRAEVSDIHAAVIDGADGLLLNAECSVGKYPLDSLVTMNDICISAEQHFPYQEFFLDMLQNAQKPMTKSEAVANSVVRSAFNLHSPVILAQTDIGRLTRNISKYRPFSQVIVICNSARTANACVLSRSCNGMLVKKFHDTDSLIQACLDMLKKSQAVKKDADIVFVSGVKDERINSQFQMKFIQIQ